MRGGVPCYAFRMTSTTRLLPLLVLLCTGCTVRVARLDPTPNLDLAPTSKSLSLAMDEAVRDSLVFHYYGPAQMEVNDWRRSLERGFTNGFKNSHSLGQEPSELTLQLLEVSPGVVFGSVGDDLDKVTGRIRFKARLLDARGNILKRLTGTVTAHKDALTKEELPLTLQSAVEAMYEEIAANFFGASVAGVVPSATN